MGEAIAQRLMSRLEQGNWQFRFVLNPKNMGEVQVNLHMQAGGLDGSFVASQAATRDLLSDGLQRLRETLNAAGMNVASLDVGAGNSSRQGQQSMAAADPQPSNGFRAQTPGTQDGPVAARHRESLGGEQGWDVLV
jgi:flagellar hook-length control protein FliK